MTELTCIKCGRYFQAGKLDQGQTLECPTCGALQDATPDRYDAPVSEGPREVGEIRRDLEPHRGPLIMVLGIVSLVMLGFLPPLGIPFGIAAWVMGRGDLKKIRAGVIDPDGESKTNAGRLCGLVGTIISTSMTLFLAVFYVFIFGMIFTMRATTPPPRVITSPPVSTPIPMKAVPDVAPEPLEPEKP
jgi:hypothetical protein